MAVLLDRIECMIVLAKVGLLHPDELVDSPGRWGLDVKKAPETISYLIGSTENHSGAQSSTAWGDKTTCAKSDKMMLVVWLTTFEIF